jgi:hypothetical protein
MSDLAGFVNFEDFRSQVILAFPPEPFYGVASTHDECDEGIALRRELPGKSWDEIPASFIDDNSLSLPLLKPTALVAFFPAWLLRAAETFGSDSLNLEFLVYFLCPGSEDEGWDDEKRESIASLFSPTQRELIGRFLSTVLEDKEFDWFHGYIRHALKSWQD